MPATFTYKLIIEPSNATPQDLFKLIERIRDFGEGQGERPTLKQSKAGENMIIDYEFSSPQIPYLIERNLDKIINPVLMDGTPLKYKGETS